jgi:hypothetical protein
MDEKKIRTRDDGRLEGVNGPLFPCLHGRDSIAGRMGWVDGGKASAVITDTLSLLAAGKSVKLTSHFGYCIFQPLADAEDGANIPASRAVVYGPDGKVIERTIGQADNTNT